MEISVYLLKQNHLSDDPAHFSTQRLARLVLIAELAKPVGQNAIQLMVDLSWKEVKLLARQVVMRAQQDLIPDLPIREYPLHEMCLNADFQRQMAYPILIAKDQRSSWSQA